MNKEKYREFIAKSNDNQKRADRILRQFIRNQSLSGIYKAFRKGLIYINDKKAKPEQIVWEGDSILIYKNFLREEKKDEKIISQIEIEKIAEQIIYEDSQIIGINKKKGQLVHGEKDSLEELMRAYLKDRIKESLSFRPGPLHRLDRNTSGLIFFSKSIEGARNFSLLLQEKKLIKYYVTLLEGRLKSKETWADNLARDDKKKTTFVSPLNGKNALSKAIPIYSEGEYTLALIKIETGRTHQIRAHAKAHGHPLAGDTKYGGKSSISGYFLHCLAITEKNEKNVLNLKETIAPIDKIDIKRLNRIFPSCNMTNLEKRLKSILEEL